MTDSAQELAQLQAQLAELKAKKEVEAAKQELKQLESGQTRFEQTVNNQEEVRSLKSARVRCWGVAAAHFVLPPAASAVYCSKTGKWLPFAVGTGVAFAGIPLAIFDLGFTAAIGAPAASAALIINQVQEDRRKNKFTLPEEADAAYFSRF